MEVHCQGPPPRRSILPEMTRTKPLPLPSIDLFKVQSNLWTFLRVLGTPSQCALLGSALLSAANFLIIYSKNEHKVHNECELLIGLLRNNKA